MQLSCEKVISKSMWWKGVLKLHVMTHTGARPLSCDLFDAIFSRKGNIKLHVMTHTGETPFQCDLCDATFLRKIYIIKHVMNNTGERPSLCDLCGAAFSRKGHLKRHVVIHTGEVFLVWPVLRSFLSKHLVKYVVTHHMNKTFLGWSFFIEPFRWNRKCETISRWSLGCSFLAQKYFQ